MKDDTCSTMKTFFVMGKFSSNKKNIRIISSPTDKKWDEIFSDRMEKESTGLCKIALTDEKRIDFTGTPIVDLGEVYTSLLEQPEGEEGLLQTNGTWNLFHVLSKNNVVMMISIQWHDARSWEHTGWRIFIKKSCVEDDRVYGSGNCVFCQSQPQWEDEE